MLWTRLTHLSSKHSGTLGWDTNCGAVGIAAGDNGGGYDYITIPNGQCDFPSTIATAVTTISNDRYCGTEFQCLNTNAIGGTPANTVCTNSRPFKIAVHSDDAEYSFPVADGEGSLANNRGFKISKTICIKNYKYIYRFQAGFSSQNVRGNNCMLKIF